jgi:hypothetical protein
VSPRIGVIAGAIAAVLAPAVARADQRPPDRVRQVHASVGGGTYLGLTGAGWGPIGVAELYPAGRFGRLGVRGELRGYEGADAGQVTAGVVYEAAASRPRLQLAVYADAGVTWGDDYDPVAGGGVETHLWVWGPIAIATTGGLSLRIDGTDSVLSITGTGELRLAW